MQPFRIEDLFELTTLGDLQGRSGRSPVVFTASTAMSGGDKYQTTLWQLDSAGGGARQLTTEVFAASSPMLAPDAGSVAFLSARQGNAKQVHVVALDGGEARQLTNSERQLQTIEQWSPDGKRLLLTARVPWAEDDQDDTGITEGRPLVVNFLPYKLDGSGPQVGARTVLLQVDAESGDERVLVEGDFDVAQAAWSPDGRQLAFVRTRDGAERHLLDLWLADADGGNARQASRELASLSGLSWSPDGKRIAFGGSAAEGDSMSRLYLFDVERDSLEQPIGDTQLEGTQIVWHEDGRRLALILAVRGLQEVTVVDVETGKHDRVDSGLQQASTLCAAGDRLLFVAVRMDRPDEVHAVDWDGSSEDVLTDFNSAWFSQKEQPRVEKRAFQVPDGEGGTEEVEAWLLLPAGGDGPFPLLVDFHGGPQSHVLIDFASHVYWYELLSKGWAILAPNAVGSGSYGVDFARRMIGRWGELDLPQHMAMIDALQEEGIASERLACTGKSYGGYLAAWAIGQTKRFRRAVVSAPISDVESHTGTSDTGYYVGPYSMGGEIDEVREVYHRLSPIEFCQEVETPTLLLQGQDDQRCPLGQSEALFANLVRCSKVPARMVVYPGGSHSLAATGKPSHRVDYHRRLSRWVREEG